MKKISAYEQEFFEHPERFTFEYFRETKLDPHPEPVALSLADEELLNHYDNQYYRHNFNRTLFFPQLDPNGPEYPKLENYVADMSATVLSERFIWGADSGFQKTEFLKFRKHLIMDLHTFPEIQKIQLLKKIAIKTALPPSDIEESAGLFSVGSSLFAMEFYLGLKNAKKWNDFKAAWPSSDKELREIAETPEVLLTLWNHQIRARDRWLDAGGRGVLEMATATGKTLVGLASAYSLFKRLGSLRVLVLCHSRAILDQWRRETIEKLGFAGDSGDDYTRPVSYKGKFEISFNTIQKVMKDPGQYQTDLLIVDEVHHGGGLKFRKALTVPCRFKMGLSATVEGKEKTSVLGQHLGKTVFTYTLANARKDGIIPDFNLAIHKTFLEISEEAEFASTTESIRKLLNFINATQNRKIHVLSRKRFDRFESLGDFVRLMTDLRYRNTEIPEEWLQLIGLINKRRWVIHRSSPKLEQAIALARNLGRTQKCVMFAMDIATCEKIYERLSGSVPAFIVHSKLKNKNINSSLQKFRSSQNGVLIAPKMLDEGIDIPDAEVGINVASSKTRLQLIQRLGRILRNRPGKHPVFHHFVAIPCQYIVSEDSFSYQNDLAWITDVALKMGIPITESTDESDGFSRFEHESEAAICSYYNSHDRLTTDDFGVINISNIVDAILPEARARLIRLLGELTRPLTDEKWARLLRSAYGDEQMLEIPSQRWLLIIAGRDPARIRELILSYGGSVEEVRPDIKTRKQSYMTLSAKPAKSGLKNKKQPNMTLSLKLVKSGIKNKKPIKSGIKGKKTIKSDIKCKKTPSNPAQPLNTVNMSRVDFWIVTLKTKRAQTDQDRAVNFLVKEGAASVEPLIALLHDPDQKVREQAINALGQIGDQRTTKPLTSCLWDSSQGVRKRAARALGVIGDPRAGPVLMKLQRDPDPGVQKAATRALRSLKKE